MKGQANMSHSLLGICYKTQFCLIHKLDCYIMDIKWQYCSSCSNYQTYGELRITLICYYFSFGTNGELMNLGVQLQFKSPSFRTGDRTVTICFNSIGIP